MMLRHVTDKYLSLYVSNIYQCTSCKTPENSYLHQYRCEKPHISRKYYHFEVSTDIHTKNMRHTLYKVVHIDVSLLHMNGYVVRAAKLSNSASKNRYTAPFVRIILLVKGCCESVHIIAVGL